MTLQDNEKVTLQSKKDPEVVNPYKPHAITILKGPQGFGFNVRGQIDEGGQLRSINGVLYPPLQHISAVIPDGPAAVAGVVTGDRILEVNNECVEGATHSRVIELIKAKPEKLQMVLVGVPPKDGDRLDGEAVSYFSDEDFDIKPVDINIPDISQMSENGAKYVSYNIYIDKRFVCSHRYKTFHMLQNDLKAKFYHFEFPKFPWKWPFALSTAQLEARHKGLEKWLEQVCSVKQLYEHFYMREFLGMTKENGVELPPENVNIKITLPDKSAVTVNIPAESGVKFVCSKVCEKLNIREDLQQHFCLFRKDKAGVCVPLEAEDRPHEMLVEDYHSSGGLVILFKKFVFTPAIEVVMFDDEGALSFLYTQSLQELNNDCFDTTGKEIEIKRNQHPTTRGEFIRTIHGLAGYGSISFEHCACDSRKDGHIILSCDVEKISIQACDDRGVLQDQVKTFQWEHITNHFVDIGVFTFTVSKGTNEKNISLTSEYCVFMNKTFERILWEKKQ